MIKPEEFLNERYGPAGTRLTWPTFGGELHVWIAVSWCHAEFAERHGLMRPETMRYPGRDA